jgi:uncharacterized protein YbjT (DUF2867 family)
MLIITGATGQLGKRIVEKMLRRVPAHRIGVSVRSLDKASDLAAQGVRVRQADYDQPESLRRAWEGAEQVLLVSSNAAASGGDPIAQHANAIAVAQDLGVQRMFYTSHISASPLRCFRQAGIMLRPRRCWRSPGSHGRRYATASTQKAC